MMVMQYPKAADGKPLPLICALVVDSSGNSGSRLKNPPSGPDGAPLLTIGCVLTDATGNGGARLTTRPLGPDGSPLPVYGMVFVDATGAILDMTGSGGGVVIPPTGLSAAVIAFDAANGWATGQNPPALAITLPIDGSIQIGDFYRIEHSQNAFATSLFTAWTQISSDDVINSIEAGGYTFVWDATTLPAGSTNFRLFFGRGANAGAITLQSLASNIITDVLSAPDATVTLVGGAYNTPLFDKAQYAAVLTPFYQAVCGADTGVGQTCRANKAATNADFYIEYEVNGFAAGGSMWFGLDDRSVDLSATPADNKPGETTPGFAFGFAKAATQLYGQWNSAEGNLLAAITAAGGILPGDHIGIAYHGSIANPVVAVSHIRGGTPGLGNGTIQRLGTVALTSQKPASVYPYIQVAKGNGTVTDGNSDCGTLKPKIADWLGTPPSDGVTYSFAA